MTKTSKPRVRVDWRKVWADFDKWYDRNINIFAEWPAQQRAERRAIQRLVRKHTTIL